MVKQRSIVVSGDVAIDCHLAVRAEWHHGAARDHADCVSSSESPGGAALLGTLVDALCAPVADVHRVVPDANDDPSLPRSVAVWKKQNDSWHIDRMLGMDHCHDPGASCASGVRPNGDPKAADIVVLDDAGTWIRKNADRLPAAIRGHEERPWIVWKISNHERNTVLWQEIRDRAERTIAVVDVDELRRLGLPISQGLSWERTAQDIVAALEADYRLVDLGLCGYVVVSIGSAGGVVIHRVVEGGPICTLVFDPFAMEVRVKAEGGVVGKHATFVAALVSEIAHSDGEDVAKALIQGVESGCVGVRRLQEVGYASVSRTVRSCGCQHLELAFPLEEVRVAVEQSASATEGAFSRVRVPRYDPNGRPWSILESRYGSSPIVLATTIAKFGLKRARIAAPVATFGGLQVLDRMETEAYRNLHRLIEEYRCGGANKPISIAVFGPPGAGKSFGIKQVAKQVGDGAISRTLTFNLSQFTDGGQLVGALHQIRDACLSGGIPLVFWDEFDSDHLRWLRFFLAPMQDGEFQEGQVTHNLGRCVFVFAGGTSKSMRDFELKAKDAGNKKGPDFLSRLKGFVDVVGPNPVGTADSTYLIRRAILLRSFLCERTALLDEGKMLRIDSGVLRALLQVKEYKHGARSMESVLAMSCLSDKPAFTPSCLPPSDQLESHVPSGEFAKLLIDTPFNDEDVERMARMVHEIYRQGVPGSEHTPYTSSSFDELPEDIKEENRRFVIDIPGKLLAIGYEIVPSVATGSTLSEDLIERMAIQEHERWIESKLAQGWSYGPTRDDLGKKHPALLPWTVPTDGSWSAVNDSRYQGKLGSEDLPEGQRDKDRLLVRQLLSVLGLIGLDAKPAAP